MLTRLSLLLTYTSVSCGLLLAAGETSWANATDWVVREVAASPGSSALNVDVHLADSGELLVGYAFPNATGGSGEVALSRLPVGKAFFQSETDPAPAVTSSFAFDRFGTAFYASDSGAQNSLRVGQDFLAFGSLTSSEHPYAGSSAINPGANLAINPDGLPSFTAIGEDRIRFFSSFDTKSGIWETETLPIASFASSVAPGTSNRQSLVYDSDGNPAISFVGESQAQSELTVVRRGGFGWQTTPLDSAVVQRGTSIAANSTGELGFAYIHPAGELRFGSLDLTFQHETIAMVQPHLTPRSLAYDLDGNPAIVFSEAPSLENFGPLHLARRDAQGQWSDEILPVDASLASLTFDAAGNPFVAAVTAEGIALVSERVGADFSGDGFVDRNDLAIWEDEYALTDDADADGDSDSDGVDFLEWQRSFRFVERADFNQDDLVTDQDLGVWQTAYSNSSAADADGDADSDGADFLLWQRQRMESGTPASASFAVPEPATTASLAILIATRLACRRRR